MFSDLEDESARDHGEVNRLELNTPGQHHIKFLPSCIIP